MSQVPAIFSKYLLRYVDKDGAEYFTVIRTGRSGMSHNGVARFLGLTQQGITKLVKKVRNANPQNNRLAKCLKPFAGKSLTLLGYLDARGRDILEDGFCAAIVEYYARYSKKKKDSNFKAEQALEQIHSLGTQFMQEKAEAQIQHIGMRVLIHQKTGWHPNYDYSTPDNFEQVWSLHEKRLDKREQLKHELDPELKSAIEEYRKAHRLSQKIYSDTYDAMNLAIQALKSSEIKQNNHLPKSALIRDYFETRPLFDYSGVSRLTTNFIRKDDMCPVDAVYKAAELFLPNGYLPKPVPIAENVYKANRRLKAEKRHRELAAGIQLSLPLGI